MPPFSSPSKFSCFPKPTRLPSWRARVLAPRTRPRASARERHTTGVASSRRTSRRQGRSDRRVRRRRRKAWRAAPRARAGTEVTSDPKVKGSSRWLTPPRPRRRSPPARRTRSACACGNRSPRANTTYRFPSMCVPPAAPLASVARTFHTFPRASFFLSSSSFFSFRRRPSR